MTAIPTGTKVLVVDNEQRKRHDESARIDPQRRVAAAKQLTTTLPGTRTHHQSAFTQKCSQGISVPSGVPGIVLRRPTGIKGAAMRRR